MWNTYFAENEQIYDTSLVERNINGDLMLQQILDIQSKNDNRKRIGINVSNDQYGTTEFSIVFKHMNIF